LFLRSRQCDDWLRQQMLAGGLTTGSITDSSDAAWGLAISIMIPRGKPELLAAPVTVHLPFDLVSYLA